MLARIASFASVAALSAAAFGQSLGIGDEMPAIGDDATWLKGSPVTDWQEGQVYVMDFWATWCGPCIASMPHVADIAEQYEDKGVTVIGMAIWPKPGQTPTDEFVEKKGDEITYLIAEDIDGAVAEKYMAATGSNGIPTIMIVDQRGRLAWKGHPMSGFDEALEAVVSGDFDIADAKATAAKQSKADKILEEANQLAMGGDWEGALGKIDEIIAMDIPRSEQFAFVKFQVLLGRMNETQRAYEYLETLYSGPFSDNGTAFAQSVAMFIAEGPMPSEAKDLEAAKKAAERAATLLGDDDPTALSAMASVQWAMGEHDAAVATLNKAMEHAEGQMKGQLESQLERYESGVQN